jgi:hypothetical protein
LPVASFASIVLIDFDGHGIDMAQHRTIGSKLAAGVLTVGVVCVGLQSLDEKAAAADSPSCEDYPTHTFLSDRIVADRLLVLPKDRRRELPPPCTERVSEAAVLPGTSGAAASGDLNGLFDGTRAPLERLQNGFDLYSWLSFATLNLPADPAVPFGTPDAQTIWEATFLPVDQVVRFHDDRENFNLLNLPPECDRIQEASPPTMFVAIDEVAFNQPFRAGPLIDQRGNYSLNTISMNAVMRDYIRDRRLGTYAGQQSFAGVIDFPSGERAAEAIGSIMIKASWRVLTDSDDPREFHTAKAYRFFPGTKSSASTCDVRTLGLVGLHVVHKTESRRQWIWSTFEHVRNVPSIDDLRRSSLPHDSYFFFDVEAKRDPCLASETRDGCTPGVVNQPPGQPWSPRAPGSRKSQIVRTEPIRADTQTINRAAHAFLRPPNVWTHYQLVGTQWPADRDCASESDGTKANEQPDPTCAPVPQFLPNSTLESYLQHDIGSSGGVPQSTSSCIGCHNNAVAYQKIDFGDELNLSRASAPCTGKSPKVACSSASDFTFILERVCAPMVDLGTGKPDPDRCRRDH